MLYYQAARIYDLGSMPLSVTSLEVLGSTRCYVSDIVNRLGDRLLHRRLAPLSEVDGFGRMTKCATVHD